jgi:hypothetical protein
MRAGACVHARGYGAAITVPAVPETWKTIGDKSGKLEACLSRLVTKLRPAKARNEPDVIMFVRRSRQYGTSWQDTVDRLRRDRPDLAERVMRGELSAHAAAIEAGFRKKPTPSEMVAKLLPMLTDDQFEQAVREERARRIRRASLPCSDIGSMIAE